MRLSRLGEQTKTTVTAACTFLQSNTIRIRTTVVSTVYNFHYIEKAVTFHQRRIHQQHFLLHGNSRRISALAVTTPWPIQETSCDFNSSCFSNASRNHDDNYKQTCSSFRWLFGATFRRDFNLQIDNGDETTTVQNEHRQDLTSLEQQVGKVHNAKIFRLDCSETATTFRMIVKGQWCTSEFKTVFDDGWMRTTTWGILWDNYMTEWKRISKNRRVTRNWMFIRRLNVSVECMELQKSTTAWRNILASTFDSE